MHGNICAGDHRIIRFGESRDEGHVYADVAAVVDNGRSTCLALKDDTDAAALMYLTDAEAIELAEQLLCSVSAARIARAVAEALG